MTSIGEANWNPASSSLDWAVINLLQIVRSRFLTRHIDFLASACKSSDERTIRLNIESAFHALDVQKKSLGAINDSKILDQDQAESDSDWTINRLRNDGYKLFNSYYYVAVRPFGQSRDHYFFPVLPGRSSLPNQHSNNDEIEFHNYLRTLQLPFRLVGDDSRNVDYSGLLLPGRVGLTPQLCLLSQKLSNQSAIYVPNFLGDIAVLSKAEDVVQRHLSAIVAPFIKNNQCLGAFLLTCAMPYAFEPSRDWKPADELALIIRDWLNAPLSLLHSNARLECQRVIPRLEWRVTKAEQPRIPEAEERLKEATKDAFNDLRQNGEVVLTHKHTTAYIHAFSFDALSIAIKTSMAPGPMLASSMYTDPMTSGETIDDIKLSKVLASLAKVDYVDSICARASELHFTNHVESFDALLSPSFMTKRAGDLRKKVVNKGSSCVVGIYRKDCTFANVGAVQSGQFNLIETISDRISEMTASQRPGLPGERPHVYSLLEALHHQRFHRESLKATESIQDDIYNLVRAALKVGYQAVLFFERVTVFEPREVADWPPSLKRTLLAPATFWVLDEICQLLSLKSLPFDRLCSGSYYYPATFVAPASIKKKIIVEASNDTELNCKYASALNYLGIPVGEWRSFSATNKNSSNTDQDLCLKILPSIDHGTNILQIYQQFLMDSLSCAECIPALVRLNDLASTNVGAARIHSITCVRKDSGLTLEFEYSSEGELRNKRETYWYPTSTWRLEFANLDTDKFVESAFETMGKPESRDTTTQAWSVEDGWKNLSKAILGQNFEAAITEVDVACKREKELKTKFFNRSYHHELKGLLGAIYDLVGDVSLPTHHSILLSKLASIVSGKIGVNFLLPYRKRLAVSDELILFGMRNALDVPEEYQAQFWASLQSSWKKDAAFEDNIRTLLFIAARQGVRQAKKRLGCRLLCDIDGWSLYLVNLTLRKADWRGVNDLHLSAYNQTSNQHRGVEPRALLVIVLVFASTYKHSMIELLKVAKLRGREDVKPSGVEKVDFERLFAVEFTRSTLTIWNASEPQGNAPKNEGTFATIDQVLTEGRWYNSGGKILFKGWESLDNCCLPKIDKPTRFKLALSLPTDFWQNSHDDNDI